MKASHEKRNAGHTTDHLQDNIFKATRIQFELSTEELSRMAEIDHATLLKIESNPQLVSLHDLYSVANCLNLDPGYVLEFLHSLVIHGEKA